LVVKVLEAKGLKNVDGLLAGLSDPYFVARIGAKGSTWDGKGLPSGGLEFTSQVIRNDLNPKWDAVFSLDLTDEEWVRQLSTHRLEVCVKIYDHDLVYSRTELGEICQEIILDKAGQRLTCPVLGSGNTGTVDVQFLKDSQKQMKNIEESRKSTPQTLHEANDPDLVSTLITDAKMSPDARDKEGKTPLHKMVAISNFNCGIALIINGANVNLTEKSTGDTPLHIAVDKACPNFVRALLVFDARTDGANNKGYWPYQIALKAYQTSPDADKLKVLYSLWKIGAECAPESAPLDSEGKPIDFSRLEVSVNYKRVKCLFDDFLNQQCRTSGDKTKNPCRVLALDGGGIRGVVLTRVLLSLEKILPFSIAKSFDWMVGTSTGGMLVLAMASGMSVLQAQGLYLRMKEQVFNAPKKPYNVNTLSKLLKSEFKDATLADIPRHPKICVSSVLANRTYPDLHFFRNYPSPQAIASVKDYDHPEEIQNFDVDTDVTDASCWDDILASECQEDIGSSKPYDQIEVPPVPIWKVARATSAAPLYFDAVGPFVDGGLLANNPTVDVLTEITEFNTSLEAKGEHQHCVEPKVVLSLGTAIQPVRKVKVADIEISVGNLMQNLFDDLHTASALGNIVTDSGNRAVDRGRAWCKSLGVPFFRYSPQLKEPVEMDEKDMSKLINLMWDTMAYCHQHHNDLKKLADILQN